MRNIILIGVSMLAVIASAPVFGKTSAPEDTSAQSTPTLPSASVQADQTGEIIVTATKRVSTLQNVPLSVSVTGIDTIEKAQIRDLIDLQSVVPSLKVQQLNAVGQTNFIIRGFGNGAGNDGIESSVGVFVDGVYRSRSFAALDDLPEIDRIEVLRGPQSTLFGKNVSAGAISIITRKPQFEFGAKAEVSVGNYGLIQSRATATGPITDHLAISVFGALDEREGYQNNIATGSKVDDRNRQSVRVDLLWTPTTDLSVRLIGDYNAINEKCCGVVTLQNGPATQFIGATAPFGLGKLIGDPAQRFGNSIYMNTDPRNRLQGGGVSAQIDYNLGFATATSITAYRRQLNESFQDVDFTSADIASKDERSDAHTFTQEFRLASNGKGPLNWLIGGFYEDETLFSGRQTSFGHDARPYIDGLTGGNVSLLEKLQGFVTPAVTPAIYFAPRQGIADFYHLRQTAYSIFGQADYKILLHLTLTGGVAYLNDRKATVSEVTLTDRFSLLIWPPYPSCRSSACRATRSRRWARCSSFMATPPTMRPLTSRTRPRTAS